MYTRLDRAHRMLPVILASFCLAGVGMLLVCDFHPARFSAAAHNWLEAFPLGLIALAYLLYQSAHRPPVREWVKAILLAIAFLFWSANQVWPDLRQATIFNDLAIALFTLDIFLVIIGWPSTSPDESFGETSVRPDDRRIGGPEAG